VLLHPVLLRERTDKTVDVGSVGMTQITAFLDDASEEVVRATRRVSAEIVRRAVFVKETAGQIAVRKYVVVRTHKEHEGMHPPFVVFCTDYSANRKEPLQTSLRTAATEPAADAHVAAWTAQNVKRGWAEVPAQRKGAAPPEEERAVVAVAALDAISDSPDAAAKPKRARKKAKSASEDEAG
nr:hypothetical protein [Myxococcota bacterium]